MPAANTSNSFGTVTRTFHWLMAFMIFAMIPLGIIATGNADAIKNGATDPALLARTQTLFSIHKTLGVAIFVLALLRILWALTQPKPDPLHAYRRTETFLASLVHWLLYASLILVPLTGWIHHAATDGFAPIWWPFGQSLPFVAKSASLAETAATLHMLFERVLVLSILVHVLGALKHHFIDRDATLMRMLAGTPADGADHTASFAAPLAATAIFAAAIGTGAGLGLFAHDTQQTTALATAPSEWTVTNGTLAITTTQLNSPVAGQFAEWTAAISYDPAITSGPAGEVTTTIAIPSLSLGTVSSQAMGFDYFDSATFPTATYTGTLIAGPDGLTSDGTLTIKDLSIPVAFPFDLTLADNTAQMTASLSINRLDFGVGTNTDTATLGADVEITIELEAER